MKNDMKVIMESWRNSAIISEEPDYAMDFVRNIDPIEFSEGSIGQFLLEVTSVVTGGKSFKEVLEYSIRKMDDQIDNVEDRKANKTIKSVLKFGLSRGIGYTMGAILAPFTGGSSTILTPILGEIFAGTLEKLTEMGVAQLEKVKAALNVPDSERGNYKTADMWDINDDLIKIIAGADGDFSRKEFTSIAGVYMKILKALQQIENTVRTSYESGQSSNIKGYLQQPLETILKWDEGSANAAAQKKYADAVNLSDDYTIQKNPTGPTP